MLSLRSDGPRPLPTSAHRLQPGLPGYLIPFAPLAFVSQRQQIPSRLSSPLAFQTISTHFTAPPSVPSAPRLLKTASISSHSPVEPGDFTRYLTARLHTL